MRRKACVVASLLCLLFLASCSRNYFTEIELTDIPGENPNHPVWVTFLEALEDPDGTAMLETDPDTGDAYLLVTTGEKNKLKQSLKIADHEYDADSKTFTVYLTNYMPRMGVDLSISSSDWQSVVRFRKYSFETLRVVVDVEGDEDGSEQKVYELTFDR